MGRGEGEGSRSDRAEHLPLHRIGDAGRNRATALRSSCRVPIRSRSGEAGTGIEDCSCVEVGGSGVSAVMVSTNEYVSSFKRTEDELNAWGYQCRMLSAKLGLPTSSNGIVRMIDEVRETERKRRDVRDS